MTDRSRTDQALTLLARPGAYEVLHAIQSRNGIATFAQIAAEARQPLTLLRALVTEGLVISHRSGTLDIEPGEQTHFCLTAKGEAVAGHLLRLQEWAASRPRRHRRPRLGAIVANLLIPRNCSE
ncbi:hypothetical protein EV385_0494 [Krasilnikovia cinnamomea]|uniref:HxlR family transcriptional regulator n=1 Tax=Krasilnikovia cinnamomea TaxID=349313 RepID=A0A4Q7ZDL4_9ACTN|nr:hypothetical protein [Krasilnikovia cinnamomea]RZU48770.1 hypothetical protein EV385_0494 [Krasilnikovia cinnamomea]